MIIVMDVQYTENTALAAGVIFENWQSNSPLRTITQSIENIAPYEAGSFFKRELPCLLSILAAINEPLEAIIIDGFVTLGEDQHHGLGAHLYHAINQKTPIIGVAKRSFIGTPKVCELLRGDSQNPLYITVVGLPVDTAKAYIASMHGQYRIPTLLRLVDQLCRGII
jgi:deoxyribonuclease V